MKAILTISLVVLIASIGFSFETKAQARKLTERIVTPANTPVPPDPPATPPSPPPRVATPTTTPVQVVTNVVPEKTKEQKDKLVRKTIEFQKKQAESGAPSAQYDLGMRYLKGDGLEKDLDLARKWLAASATNENSPAVKQLEELNKK